jgi:hypothetical protein
MDVTSSTPLKLPIALLLLLILHNLNMQELAIPGIPHMGCYNFNSIIKAEGKGGTTYNWKCLVHTHHIKR